MNGLSQDVLVERTREIALEQLVVVDRLGNDATDELEIAQVIRIAIRKPIGHVRHPIAGRRFEERVVRIEHLARHDEIPLAQKPAGVLPVFAFEHDVESIFHLLRRTTVQLAIRILEHVVATNVHDHVLASHAAVHALQFLAKVALFHVEIEQLRVMD